ncbi:acyl-CoA reductase [Roseateles sp. BYS78W]|uniref:Acyl-CoA reductase n=1 Tax=Pelomonas candidula TaxID=3299025 RepID=A0ABW7HHS5_9BURK
MSIRYLLGTDDGTPFEGLLDRCAAAPAWAPFDARATAFVARFSQRLLTHPQARQFPEMAALGHWFRGASLRDLAAQYPARAGFLRLGRGLAFHVAPANVDSVFMYSWLLSLLAGNANLVRVSQKGSPQQDFVIEALRATLAEPVGEPVAGRFVLLTYPHDDAITGAISARSQLRVVWGGDATVATLRAIPLRPTATELCFPDRFSAAALSAAAVLALDDAGLARLAQGFYNDAFWFAQQACSSPRMLAWVGGGADVDAAALRFWAAVAAELTRRDADNSGAMTMARVAASFEYAAAGLAHLGPNMLGSYPLRLVLDHGLTAAVKEVHCGNGLFLEQRTDSLAALAEQFSDREQTLSVFGFGEDELMALMQAVPARAIDRLVPIGRALDFSPVWDGQDLILSFSRLIALPIS